MRRAEQILLASMMLGGFSLPNDVKEVNGEFQYDEEILAEYELIKQKQSRLPRNKREIIEAKALRILARRENKMP